MSDTRQIKSRLESMQEVSGVLPTARSDGERMTSLRSMASRNRDLWLECLAEAEERVVGDKAAISMQYQVHLLKLLVLSFLYKESCANSNLIIRVKIEEL